MRIYQRYASADIANCQVSKIIFQKKGESLCYKSKVLKDYLPALEIFFLGKFGDDSAVNAAPYFL